MEQSVMDDTDFYAFKRGDQLAFGKVFRTYYPPLCSFAYQLIKDDEKSHEIVSDQFVKIWKRHATIDGPAGLKAFAYKIVRNACYDFLKFKGNDVFTRKMVDTECDNIENIAEAEEAFSKSKLLDLLYKEIEMLPPMCKKVFCLKLTTNMTNNEIATELNLSPHTVRNHFENAKKTLKSNVGYFLLLLLTLAGDIATWIFF